METAALKQMGADREQDGRAEFLLSGPYYLAEGQKSKFVAARFFGLVDSLALSDEIKNLGEISIGVSVVELVHQN